MGSEVGDSGRVEPGLGDGFISGIWSGQPLRLGEDLGPKEKWTPGIGIESHQTFQPPSNTVFGTSQRCLLHRG